MASPSSPYLHHPAQYGGAAYGHPAVGGKGLPMHVPAQAYDPSSPAPSSPSVASSSARWPHQPGLAGGPPDLTERYRLKAKYLKLQKRYFRSIEIRKDLTLELAEKEEKVQQLQDEVDLILDQIHDSDYAHLRPKHDSLFSDDEDVGFELDDEEDESPHVKVENGEETLEGDVKGKKRMRLRDLEDEEDERRKELEAKYGIDGTKQVVTVAPPEPTPPPPAPIPAAALPVLPPIHPAPAAHPASIAAPSSAATYDQQQALAQAEQPAAAAAAPKRLKLTFGGGGGASASFT
ncbi:hypothetical protein NBRC10512_004557 [Rhodotorula toruloides]|uniref:RHTO0S10e03884g1_1 n=1 Tax=Rhodotorula toruloides TaxID=5286 RepID=A0A061BDF1_RHOTO|nr:RHTO0S10e03884g1_1 [Rhodotorula toruloides]